MVNILLKYEWGGGGHVYRNKLTNSVKISTASFEFLGFGGGRGGGFLVSL